jgi:hypothetical protein
MPIGRVKEKWQDDLAEHVEDVALKPKATSTVDMSGF